MFITMIMARHKTKHLKFMVGLPVIIILQIALVVLLVTQLPAVEDIPLLNRFGR
jgi:uncharacterized membrane protein YsdA (DUF1294 family)